MSRVKLIVVVFTVILAFNVAASAAASAATAGWMVNGTQLVGIELLPLENSVTEHFKVLTSEINMECVGDKIDLDAGITPPNKGYATAVIFRDCESNTAGCTEEPAEIETLPILLSEVTLDGTLAVKGAIVPETKTILATFKFEGADCEAGGLKTVKGKLRFLAQLGQNERAAQPTAFFTESGDLTVGSAAASLKGAVELRVASGSAWSFL